MEIEIIIHPDWAYIYALCDPESEIIRYIGKTNNPTQRFWNHCSTDGLKTSTRKNNWIKSLMKNGLRPKLKVLARVPYGEWQMHEINWIAMGRKTGWPLLNGTMGGDGTYQMGLPMAPEIRAKISKANTGKKYSPEIQKKLGAIRKAYHANMTPEQKDAWRSKRGHKYTDEQRAAKSLEGRYKKSAKASSRYMGVYWFKPCSLWTVQIMRNKKCKSFGYFKNEEDAARKYDDEVVKIDGPAAKLNFPK